LLPFTDDDRRHFKALEHLVASVGICERVHEWKYVSKSSNKDALLLMRTYFEHPLRKPNINCKQFHQESRHFFECMFGPRPNENLGQRHEFMGREGRLESLMDKLSRDPRHVERVVPEASRDGIKRGINEVRARCFVMHAERNNAHGPLFELTRHAVENVRYNGKNESLPNTPKPATVFLPYPSRDIPRLEDWARRPDADPEAPKF
jgi:hypothetical protein